MTSQTGAAGMDQPPADQSIIRSIDARPDAVRVAFVRAGEAWCFDAEGLWKDWFVTCGPEGYRVALLEFLDIRPKVRSAGWFELVGEVAGAPETVVIGRGVEHTFRHGGDFVVYANDAPSMRWNNHGAVTLRARRLPAPTPPAHHAPPHYDTSLAARWLRFRAAFDRTQGFLFIAALLLTTGLGLTASPQGEDIITTVAQDGWNPTGGPTLSPKLAWLCATTFLLGFEAWFWARAIVEFRFGARAGWKSNWALALTPRLFGVAPFVFLLWGLWRSNEPVGWPGAVLSVSGAAFLGFIVWRDAITRALQAFTGRVHARRPRVARAVSSVLLGVKSFVLLGSLAAAAVCMIVAVVLPVRPATAIGPASVVLLAAALVIPFMILAIQMGSLLRIPVTPLLIAWAVLLSLWVDNHAVRLTAGAAPPRAGLEATFERWRALARPNAAGEVPIVFVASEGGASRAGFWTGDALAVLEGDTDGAFSRQLFAISSISGGSLGAVGYLATLHDNPALKGAALRRAVDDFTSGDYLSAALAGMFFPDLLQRFVFPAFLPDRASALERSWEVGWRDHCAAPADRCHDRDLLRRGFLSLWAKPTAPWTPMLVIGGAREEDGHRLLTSSVDLGGAVDADDFHTVMRRDVRLSTAILNGARFPFVSPGGTLRGATPGRGGHIVDGGYFDAAGVEALRELANATLAGAAGAPRARPLKLRPIFVVLASTRPGRLPTHPVQFAVDALGPLLGLFQSGPAHGDHLMKLLNADDPRRVCDGDGCAEGDVILAPKVLTIAACRAAPLDWALSRKARKALTESLEACPGNKEKIGWLVGQLEAHG